jgi:hypothetical protein
MAGKKGIYQVVNVSKYVGKSNPSYRSNLEARLCFYMDNNSNIVRWGYENISLPYPKPVVKDNGEYGLEWHRYILDFWAEIIGKDGVVKRVLIEVKPEKETRPPVQPKRITAKNRKKYMNEASTYMVNQAKWNAAGNFCNSKGMQFLIITDKMIN